SHWKDDALTGILIGAMDPTLRTGTVQTISAADERALELIGWTLVGNGAGTTTSTIVPTTSTIVPTTPTIVPTTPTSPSTTTSVTSITTSTTVPLCVTPRCRLDGALHGTACEGATIPASLSHRIERATAVTERAEKLFGRKARRTLARARRLLQGVGRQARSASTGRRAKLAPGRAAALQEAIGQLVARLAPGARLRRPAAGSGRGG